MNLDLPLDQSVIVFASYRTGSTALCDHISKKFKFINFDEAFHPAIPKKQQPLQDTSTKYRVVVKIMPDHIDLCQKQIDQLRMSRPCTLIRLTRADVVKQIASYYISSRRQVWHRTSPDNIKYSVKINKNLLAGEINYIKECNQRLENLNYNFAFDLEYNDLSGLDTKYKISKRPENYLELITTIENMI